LFDIDGLVVPGRTDLAEFQKPFARDLAPTSSFVEAIAAKGRPDSSGSVRCRSFSPER
jgi:hypothetical protein